MICERCLGTGKAFIGEPPIPRHNLAAFLAKLNEPCPDCGGSGTASCCDAAGSAQPEPEDKRDD